MRKTLATIFLLCISMTTHAVIREEGGWRSNNMFYDGTEMLTILNSNSSEGSRLQLVFDKTAKQCLTTLSIGFGGYEDESMTKQNYNCFVQTGEGEKQYSEKFKCSVIGSKSIGVLLFNLQLNDKGKARLLDGIQQKSTLSFTVLDIDLRETFDMKDPHAFIQEGLDFCG